MRRSVESGVIQTSLPWLGKIPRFWTFPLIFSHTYPRVWDRDVDLTISQISHEISYHLILPTLWHKQEKVVSLLSQHSLHSTRRPDTALRQEFFFYKQWISHRIGESVSDRTSESVSDRLSETSGPSFWPVLLRILKFLVKKVKVRYSETFNFLEIDRKNLLS